MKRARERERDKEMDNLSCAKCYDSQIELMGWELYEKWNLEHSKCLSFFCSRN